MDILKGYWGGVEWMVRKGRTRIWDEEEEISREELRKVMNRLKMGRQWGEMGFRMRFGNMGGEEVERWLWEICNKVEGGRMARGMERGNDSANYKEGGGRESRGL